MALADESISMDQIMQIDIGVAHLTVPDILVAVGLLAGVVIGSIKVTISILSVEQKLPTCIKRPLYILSGKTMASLVGLHNFHFRLDLFEKFFGRRFISLKRLRSAAFFSILSLSISFLMVQTTLPISNYLVINIVANYNAKLASGAAILFATTLFIDYLSIEKTRVLLNKARRQSAFLPATVLIDGALTVALFILLFPCGYALAALLYEWDQTLPFDLNFRGIAVRIDNKGTILLLAYLNQLIE
ncbi:hypothetical protein FW320_11590 [Azospirillum sp. Vi22]|uniref:hypothetical protein n=1 Tax=Azospirillum baldaniorum TaxID=1064539 RepID=UPI00157B9A59|nr:hypothetical protein [Azospirillum baldaniorum]NUB06815.1 hypothetical protein [Azospirillum baldaniorum]